MPWRPGNAEWAAEVCLKAWLAQRGGLGAGEQQRALPAVLGFSSGTVRPGSPAGTTRESGSPIAPDSGRRDGQGRTDYFFHTEGWKDACEDLVPKDVARACAEAGLLDAVLESGKLRFQKNVKVPGRGTERFYIVTGRGLGGLPAAAGGMGGRIGLAMTSQRGSHVPTGWIAVATTLALASQGNSLGFPNSHEFPTP